MHFNQPESEPEQHWEEEEVHPTEVLVPKSQNWATHLRHLFSRHWSPAKVPQPSVDPELEHLTGIERTAEVVRHSLQSIEHWLSPNGSLREWMKFNLKVAVTLAVPSLLVVPIITFAMGQFNTWTQLLAQTTNNLIYFPLSALLMVGLISALLYFGKSLRRRPNPQDRYYYQ